LVFCHYLGNRFFRHEKRHSVKGYAGMYLKKKNLGFSKNKSLEKAVFAGNPEYIF